MEALCPCMMRLRKQSHRARSGFPLSGHKTRSPGATAHGFSPACSQDQVAWGTWVFPCVATRPGRLGHLGFPLRGHKTRSPGAPGVSPAWPQDPVARGTWGSPAWPQDQVTWGTWGFPCVATRPGHLGHLGFPLRGHKTRSPGALGVSPP